MSATDKAAPRLGPCIEQVLVCITMSTTRFSREVGAAPFVSLEP